MKKLNELLNWLIYIKENKLNDILIAIVIIIVFKVFSSLIAYCVIKIFNMKVKDKNKIKEHALYKPTKILVSVIGVYLAILVFGVSNEAMKIVNKIFRIIIIAITAFGIGNCLSPKSNLIKKLKRSDKVNVNDKATEFIGKIIRTIVYVIAGFVIASELGYDLNGIIAGLGIGSVVIAFAAQDIAKNLCSGLVLLFDKPFIIGDYIKMEECEGTVEDMTFRAVRIKTREGTIVTIPNGKISEGYITNYVMEKRQCNFDLVVTLETKIDKIIDIIEKIRQLLISNPDIINDTIEININKIVDNGININIFFYTEKVKYIDFLHLKNNVNLAILNLLNIEKVELAYDTKTIYLHS